MNIFGNIFPLLLLLLSIEATEGVKIAETSDGGTSRPSALSADEATNEPQSETLTSNRDKDATDTASSSTLHHEEAITDVSNAIVLYKPPSNNREAGPSSSSAIVPMPAQTAGSLAIVPGDGDSKLSLDFENTFKTLLLQPTAVSKEEFLGQKMKTFAWHFAREMNEKVTMEYVLARPSMRAAEVCELFDRYETILWQKRSESLKHDTVARANVKNAFKTQHPEKVKKMKNDPFSQEVDPKVLESYTYDARFERMRRNRSRPYWVEHLYDLANWFNANEFDEMLAKSGSALLAKHGNIIDQFVHQMVENNTPVEEEVFKIKYTDVESNNNNDPNVQQQQQQQQQHYGFAETLMQRILVAFSKNKQEQEADIAQFKSSLLAMFGAMELLRLELKYPFFLAMGFMDTNYEIAWHLYSNMFAKEAPGFSDTTGVGEHAEWRLTVNYVYARILKKLFRHEDYVQPSLESNAWLRENFTKLLSITYQPGLNLLDPNMTMRQRKAWAVKLWHFLMELNDDYSHLESIDIEGKGKAPMGDDDDGKPVELTAPKVDVEATYEAIRKELLWKEHFNTFREFKEREYLNDMPGMHAKFADFFGGFENIWQKMVVQRRQNDGLDMGANRDDDLMGPFRIDLTDTRIMRTLRNNIDYILKEKVDYKKQYKDIFEMRNMMGFKQARWLIDLLVSMRNLDEHFDQQGNAAIINQWWLAKVEIELFCDSLRERHADFELHVPATTFVNWMHLLLHRKCNAAGSVDDDHEELTRDLQGYILRCKEEARKTKVLINLDELKQLRAKYLYELLDPDSRFRSNTLILEFVELMEEEYKSLMEFVGAENAEEIMNMDRKEPNNQKRKDAQIELCFYLVMAELVAKRTLLEEQTDIRNDFVRIRLEQQMKTFDRIMQADEKSVPENIVKLKIKKAKTREQLINKLRWIKTMMELYEPMAADDYDAMERIQLIPFEQAQAEADQILEEFRDSDQAFEMAHFPQIEQALLLTWTADEGGSEYHRRGAFNIYNEAVMGPIERFKKHLMEGEGATYRLGLLLGMNVYGVFGKFASRGVYDLIRDPKFFHHDHFLKQHYERALFGRTELERLQHRLVANIFAWMRQKEPNLFHKRIPMQREWVETNRDLDVLHAEKNAEENKNKKQEKIFKAVPLEDMRLYFRIQCDKILTLKGEMANEEEALQKLRQIAHLHSKIFVQLSKFLSAPKKNILKEWKILRDLFKKDEIHLLYGPNGTEPEPEPLEELKRMHYAEMAKLWGLQHKDEAKDELPKERQKELQKHWMGILLEKAANSSKETRKILMKFLEFPQIQYLLGKMGVGADPKNYIDESSPPPATNEAAMARSLEEHESVFSSAEFHTADVASVGDEEEEDGAHKEKDGGIKSPELSPKHKIDNWFASSNFEPIDEAEEKEKDEKAKALEKKEMEAELKKRMEKEEKEAEKKRTEKKEEKKQSWADMADEEEEEKKREEQEKAAQEQKMKQEEMERAEKAAQEQKMEEEKAKEMKMQHGIKDTESPTSTPMEKAPMDTVSTGAEEMERAEKAAQEQKTEEEKAKETEMQHEMKDDSPPSPTMEEAPLDTVDSAAGGSSSDVNANTLRNQMKRQKKKLKKAKTAKTAGASASPAAAEAGLETMEAEHTKQTSADGSESKFIPAETPAGMPEMERHLSHEARIAAEISEMLNLGKKQDKAVVTEQSTKPRSKGKAVAEVSKEEQIAADLSKMLKLDKHGAAEKSTKLAETPTEPLKGQKHKGKTSVDKPTSPREEAPKTSAPASTPQHGHVKILPRDPHHAQVGAGTEQMPRIQFGTVPYFEQPSTKIVFAHEPTKTGVQRGQPAKQGVGQTQHPVGVAQRQPAAATSSSWKTVSHSSRGTPGPQPAQTEQNQQTQKQQSRQTKKHPTTSTSGGSSSSKQTPLKVAQPWHVLESIGEEGEVERPKFQQQRKPQQQPPRILQRDPAVHQPPVRQPVPAAVPVQQPVVFGPSYVEVLRHGIEQAQQPSFAQVVRQGSGQIQQPVGATHRQPAAVPSGVAQRQPAAAPPRGHWGPQPAQTGKNQPMQQQSRFTPLTRQQPTSTGAGSSSRQTPLKVAEEEEPTVAAYFHGQQSAPAQRGNVAPMRILTRPQPPAVSGPSSGPSAPPKSTHQKASASSGSSKIPPKAGQKTAQTKTHAQIASAASTSSRVSPPKVATPQTHQTGASASSSSTTRIGIRQRKQPAAPAQPPKMITRAKVAPIKFRLESLDGPMDEAKLHEITEKIAFKEFTEDAFLHEKFHALLDESVSDGGNAEWTLVLVLGSYINQIQHRMRAAMELRKKLQHGGAIGHELVDWEHFEHYLKRWNDELDADSGQLGKDELDPESVHLGEAVAHGRAALEKMELEFYTILRDLNVVLNNDAMLEEKYDASDAQLIEEKKQFSAKLLLHTLAKIAVEQKWEGSKTRKLLDKFLGIEETFWGENDKFENFEAEFMGPWQNMVEQREIDEQLIGQYHSSYFEKYGLNKPSMHLSKNFYEHWQKIEPSIMVAQQEETLLHRMRKTIGLDSVESEERYQHRLDTALWHVNQIVTRKFSPESFLQIIGSQQLGIVTADSEIDAILIASLRLQPRRFFGGAQAKCDAERQQCTDTDSLYCILCQDKHVFNLHKRPNEQQMLMLDFVYCPQYRHYLLNRRFDMLPAECVKFHVSFVALRGFSAITGERVADPRLLVDNFKLNENDDIYQIDWADKRAAMINALSGFQTYKLILDKMVNDRMREAFHLAFVVLQAWARNNYIYYAVYGFLNDSSLAIMLTKVLMLFPTANATFLLEQFFLHFTTWPWPTPVQLAELGGGNQNHQSETAQRTLGWRADKEIQQKGRVFHWLAEHKNLALPIIAPSLPERNAAYSVNHSTAEIIREEFQIGFSHLSNVLHKNAEWHTFTGTHTFFQHRYSYFIVFYCFALDEDSLLEFCDDFVLPKLRIQLVYSVEARKAEEPGQHNSPLQRIRRCHVLPWSDKNKAKIPDKMGAMLAPNFRNSLAKQWLVGVTVDDSTMGTDMAEIGQWKRRVNYALNKTQNGFVYRFFQQFSDYKHSKKVSNYEIRNKMMKVHLHAQFLDAHEFKTWHAKRRF